MSRQAHGSRRVVGESLPRSTSRSRTREMDSIRRCGRPTWRLCRTLLVGLESTRARYRAHHDGLLDRLEASDRRRLEPGLALEKLLAPPACDRSPFEAAGAIGAVPPFLPPGGARLRACPRLRGAGTRRLLSLIRFDLLRFF